MQPLNTPFATRWSLVAALVLVAACDDPIPLGPSASQSLSDVAVDPSRATASATWSEVARNLVRTRQSNAFQAVRNYATLNLAQYNAVIAVDRGSGRLSQRAAVAAASA